MTSTAGDKRDEAERLTNTTANVLFPVCVTKVVHRTPSYGLQKDNLPETNDVDTDERRIGKAKQRVLHHRS